MVDKMTDKSSLKQKKPISILKCALSQQSEIFN
jgi:hypothetical protein